jgi:peptidyl-prolyl cis-trans isomerase B (cyclophilin B)
VKKKYAAPPVMAIDVKKHYTATLETNKGNLVLELYAKDVPTTVNSFVFLIKEGFYDDTVFHRVIAGFVVQGGDPTGTGRGGPGYAIPDEITKHIHVTGTLSMANSGPDTNGSQFFICLAPQNHLNGHYSVFGQLTEGTDVLQKIVQGDKLIRATVKEA